MYVRFLITRPCKFEIFCRNKMAPGVSEGLFHAETFDHVRFSRKRELKPLNIPFFGHFWKIVELNTDVLEPSLLSEIDNWCLLFKMSPKPMLAPLKWGWVYVKGCKKKRNILRRCLKMNQIYLKIVAQGVFGVTNYTSSFRFKKFKMLDPIYIHT